MVLKVFSKLNNPMILPEPSLSKAFSAESKSINALKVLSIIHDASCFCSEKVRHAHTVMPSYGNVPASGGTFGQDLC